MKNYYLRVQGQLSFESIKKANINMEKTESNIALILDYSDFNIPKDSLFNYIRIDDKTYRINGQLIYITQQFSLPFDEVPIGWKTVGFFEVNETAEFIDLIPFTKGWLPIDSKIVIGFDDSLPINMLY